MFTAAAKSAEAWTLVMGDMCFGCMSCAITLHRVSAGWLQCTMVVQQTLGYVVSLGALLPLYWHVLPAEIKRVHRDETVSQKEVVWHSPAAQNA